MKKYSIQLLLAVLAGLLSCTALNAQSRHEFSFFAGGGLSDLKYDASAGKQKMDFGGQVGLGYQYFFCRNLGLGTGAEIALYNSVFNMDNLSTRYTTADMTGDNFEFRSTVSNYEEKQNAMLLQIPLMLQFQYGGKHKFYIAAGGKAGIPLSGKYKSSSASIVNTGYYDYENYEYTTPEFMGFGTFTNKNAKGDLDFKTAFFASAEIGMKWRLSDKLSLYTGAYLDYGLNDIRKVETRHVTSLQFVEYNTANPRDFAINSIVNSQYSRNGNMQSFTDKIIPMAAGIKLRLIFLRR